MKPRPYQLEAEDAAEAAYRRGARSAMIVACTGAGKTIISARMMATRAKKRRTCLFLAHREELLTQTVEKLQKVDSQVRSGILQGSKLPPSGARVIVASVKSLAANPSMLRNFVRPGELSLCITDECHHSPASSYQQIYKYLKETYPECNQLGITATPNRLDGQCLSETFEEMVYQVALYDLVDQGYLAPIEGLTIRSSTNLGSVSQEEEEETEYDFNASELGRVIDCPARNGLIVDAYRKKAFYKRRNRFRKAVVFCADIAHAENMAAAFNSAAIENPNGRSIRAVALHGKLRASVRRRILEDFEKGRIDILTNVDVLTEGWDDPTVECVILARPTLSPVLITQMVGRGVRLNPRDHGKTCYVIEIADENAKGSQTLSGLFELPPKFRLEGENLNRARKELKKTVNDNPLVSWDDETLDRKKLAAMLAPSSLFLIARGIKPENVGNYLWIRIGAEKYGVALSGDNAAILERTPLGDYLLAIGGTNIAKFTGKLEEALVEAGGMLKALFPDCQEFLHYPKRALFDRGPLVSHKQILSKAFRIPKKELDHLGSEGEGALLLARLHLSRALCTQNHRFHSGRYLASPIPLVVIYDYDYVAQKWADDRIAAIYLNDAGRLLDWIIATKPGIWERALRPHYKESDLRLWAKRSPEKFRLLLSKCMKDDLEFRILAERVQ